MSNTNDLMARLARLEADVAAKDAQIAALSVKRNAPLTLKVTEKGALSVYGLQRFPVTLYAQQWGKLLGHAATITAFIEANQDKFATKPEKAPAPAA
jgi:hypothetical protein